MQFFWWDYNDPREKKGSSIHKTRQENRLGKQQVMHLERDKREQVWIWERDVGRL
jgi:hypothetical protein